MRGAVVQLSSTADAEGNLSRAERWIASAAGAGAELVALPENFPYLRREDSERNPLAQGLDGPIVQFLREQAKRHDIVLAGGTLPEAIPNDERVYNTSVVVDRDGSVRGVYRKIHLFDVALSDVGLQESKTVAPGTEIRRALACCSCPPRSPCRPAAITGRCCSAHARSRIRPTCWPPHSTEYTARRVARTAAR
jgi:nitrilase